MCEKPLEKLFENNKAWAQSKRAEDAGFFSELSKAQHPDYLWIGCSDSRVPANHIVGLQAGELFVHRNIANVVADTDPNCLSVIQYAVEVLKVKHIIVTGHYGCGGVRAAMSERGADQIETWLDHIRDVHAQNQYELSKLDGRARVDRLCELNVVAQVRNVARTPFVQAAWREGVELAVHGWVYSLNDGILHDLEVGIRSLDELHAAQRLGG